MIRRSGLTRTGVFSQKLPDTYKSTDVTDDKSLASLAPSFVIMKKGNPFNIERPQFKRGSPSSIVDESKSTFNIAKLNKRSGLGNNTILRDSFRTPDVLGRQPVDFALQELLDRQQQGIKVQLGDKTLQDLFQVKTVDPSDVVWIAEYNRRLEAGETKEQLALSPPFGREQRVMFKKVNFGEGVSLSEKSALSTSEELKLLRASISAGSGSSDLVESIAKLFELMEKIDTFTQENYITMQEILRKTNSIPSAPEQFFGTAGYHRFWSIDQYRASEPKLMVYILTNSKTGDPTRPILSISGTPISRAELVTILTPKRDVYDSDGNILSVNGNDFYLDINNLRVVERDFVVNAVNGGEDSGQINGELPALDKISGSIRWLTTREEASVRSRIAPRPIPPPPPPPPPRPKA
jgi:hypothetical protein